MSKRPKKCKRCGLPIDFLPKGGFIVKGQSRFIVVNADNRRPHRPTCELAQALKKAKTSGRKQIERQKAKQQQQPEAATEGVQIDAFPHR